jgi:hypothetical protein
VQFIFAQGVLVKWFLESTLNFILWFQHLDMISLNCSVGCELDTCYEENLQIFINDFESMNYPSTCIKKLAEIINHYHE